MRYLRFAERELSVDDKGNPVDANDPRRVDPDEGGTMQSLMTEEKYLRLTREQQDALGAYDVLEDTADGNLILVKGAVIERVDSMPIEKKLEVPETPKGPTVRTKVAKPEGLVEGDDKS